MDYILSLNYDGGSISDGEMDAKQVAEAIRGFSDFAERSGRAYFGKKPSFSLSVKGFESNCFDIQFALHGVETVGAILSLGDTPKTFIELMKSYIELMKHLNGEKPRSVRREEGFGVHVENNYGYVINTNELTLSLAEDSRAGDSSRRFLGKPLSEVAEKASLRANDEEIGTVTRAQAKAFRQIDTSDVLTENVNHLWLKLIVPILEGSSKWRLSDGQKTMYMSVEDEDFLEKVRAGEKRFGHSDFFYVRLRSIQYRESGQLKAEYIIEEVLEHREGGAADSA